MGKKVGKGPKVLVSKGKKRYPPPKPDIAANYLRKLGFIIPKDNLS